MSRKDSSEKETADALPTSDDEELTYLHDEKFRDLVNQTMLYYKKNHCTDKNAYHVWLAAEATNLAHSRGSQMADNLTFRKPVAYQSISAPYLEKLRHHLGTLNDRGILEEHAYAATVLYTAMRRLIKDKGYKMIPIEGIQQKQWIEKLKTQLEKQLRDIKTAITHYQKKVTDQLDFKANKPPNYNRLREMHNRDVQAELENFKTHTEGLINDLNKEPNLREHLSLSSKEEQIETDIRTTTDIIKNTTVAIKKIKDTLKNLKKTHKTLTQSRKTTQGGKHREMEADPEELKNNERAIKTNETMLRNKTDVKEALQAQKCLLKDKMKIISKESKHTVQSGRKGGYSKL